jgi:3-phosphoshikimate 1-carboxyvinyltransferase
MEELDCGNSGTAMRLLAGTLSAAPFRSVLSGDSSLSARPMERVAIPLRAMGARIDTTHGHAPVEIFGGPLYGISYELPIATAQVKGAILLAGVAAEGVTVVKESAPTRDHTERALAALGAPVSVEESTQGSTITLQGVYQHEGFDATVPGDVSSAAFLIAAAALTRSEITVTGVGLNPSRLQFLAVLSRMGARVETRVHGEALGEPVGDLWIAPDAELTGTEVSAEELPLVIDEVPVLALVATHARGETWFSGAAELRAKESDRLTGVADGALALGGHAGVEGDDLVVPGLGLRGGRADARGDHRLAMAFAVAALAADAPSEIEGMEAAEVSFPGFLGTIRSLGASVEILA